MTDRTGESDQEALERLRNGRYHHLSDDRPMIADGLESDLVQIKRLKLVTAADEIFSIEIESVSAGDLPTEPAVVVPECDSDTEIYLRRSAPTPELVAVE
ncbi:hypothetical protein PNP85_10090 [Halobacterium salinarum]|uniref:hypothetical protein n=1 Tax=Halobacterium TaxID=2239 RepID=UPI0025565373|nr:hypothetical protein [Halobacterium salinarum]MDL0128174.1 hypothetical protein [Halobacterium salinarum]MDL0139852.1 hypothetical protein [Halobacterium salinarum]